MKNFIVFLLFGLSALSASSQDFDIATVAQEEEIPHSELMLRMIANDHTMNIGDYAELYCEYLEREGYALGADSREEYIAQLSQDQAFADVVELLNSYDDAYFRENIAMDIFHWMYGGGAELDEAEGFLDRLVTLSRMVEQDEEVMADPLFNEALGEVMGYFMELFFNMLGDSLSEIFESFTFDLEDGDTLFDYDDLFEVEIVEE